MKKIKVASFKLLRIVYFLRFAHQRSLNEPYLNFYLSVADLFFFAFYGKTRAPFTIKLSYAFWNGNGGRSNHVMDVILFSSH